MLKAGLFSVAITFFVVIALVCCISCAYIGYIVYIHWIYSHLPGPKCDNFILGNLLQLRRASKTGKYRHLLFLKWAKMYGPLYRIFVLHKCLIVPTSSTMIKAVLTRSDRYPKAAVVYGQLYNACGSRFLGNGLVTNTNHAEWRLRRNLLNPSFHKKTLVHSLDVFNQTADDWISSLMNVADGKTTIRMADRISRVTMDIVGKVAFNMDIGAIFDDTNPFFMALDQILDGIHAQHSNPFIAMCWWRRQFVHKVQDAVQYIRGEIKMVVAERMKAIENDENVPEDAITCMLSGMDKYGFSVDDIVDDFVTIILAGQDTVASTLSFLLNEVGRNAEVYRKLLEEVSRVIGDRRHVSLSDIGRLPYMTQTIRETLRLYPPAPATARENRSNVQLGGFHLPAGSFIVISIFVIHRLSAHYPEPELFDPERFATNRQAPLYTFLPFSIGQRTCMGKQFAFMEIKVLLCKLLQAFSYRLDADQSFEIEERNTLRPKGGTRLTLWPRTGSVS